MLLCAKIQVMFNCSSYWLSVVPVAIGCILIMWILIGKNAATSNNELNTEHVVHYESTVNHR